MVAFGVREALTAEQIYWAEMEEGKRQFRQYVNKGDVFPAIIVDDINRSGKAITETMKLVQDLGRRSLESERLLHLRTRRTRVDGVKIQSLTEFDCNFFPSKSEWKAAEGNDAPAEAVRF